MNKGLLALVLGFVTSLCHANMKFDGFRSFLISIQTGSIQLPNYKEYNRLREKFLKGNELTRNETKSFRKQADLIAQELVEKTCLDGKDFKIWRSLPTRLQNEVKNRRAAAIAKKYGLGDWRKFASGELASAVMNKVFPDGSKSTAEQRELLRAETLLDYYQPQQEPFYTKPTYTPEQEQALNYLKSPVRTRYGTEYNARFPLEQNNIDIGYDYINPMLQSIVSGAKKCIAGLWNRIYGSRLETMEMEVSNEVSNTKFVIPSTPYSIILTLVEPLVEKFEYFHDEKWREGKDQFYNDFKKIIGFTKHKKYKECIEVIDRMMKIELNIDKGESTSDFIMAMFWVMRAECNCPLKNYEQALRECENSIMLKGDSGYVYYVKALAWSGLDNENMAKACIRISAKNDFSHAKEIVIAYNL